MQYFSITLALPYYLSITLAYLHKPEKFLLKWRRRRRRRRRKKRRRRNERDKEKEKEKENKKDEEEMCKTILECITLIGCSADTPWMFRAWSILGYRTFVEHLFVVCVIACAIICWLSWQCVVSCGCACHLCMHCTVFVLSRHASYLYGYLV